VKDDGFTTVFFREISGDPKLWHNGNHIVLSVPAEFQSVKSYLGSGPFSLVLRATKLSEDGIHSFPGEILFHLIASVNANRSITFVPS
jgi:hypothetical protein